MSGPWLVVDETSRGRIEAIEPGGRVPLVDAAVVGRLAPPPYRTIATNVSQHHCRFTREDAGQWRVHDLSTTNGTILNGVAVGHEGAEVHHGDEVVIGDLVMRFVTREHSLISGIRSAGRWTLFNTLAPQLRHALSDDGVYATAFVNTANRRPLVRGDGTTTVLDTLVAHGVVVVNDVAGVSMRALIDRLKRRSEVLDPSIAAAAALVAARCALSGNVLPALGGEWVTFDGRLVILWPQFAPGHAPAPPGWRGSLATTLAWQLDNTWQIPEEARRGEDPRVEYAAYRDSVRPGPLAEQLRGVLDVAVQDGSAADLVDALASLQRAAGEPSPTFIAGLVADVFPAEKIREERLREEALTAGSAGIEALR